MQHANWKRNEDLGLRESREREEKWGKIWSNPNEEWNLRIKSDLHWLTSFWPQHPTLVLLETEVGNVELGGSLWSLIS